MSPFIRCAALALTLAACTPESAVAEPQDLPRLVPEPVQQEDGPTMLSGWHKAATGYSYDRIVPDNPAFAGAVVLTVTHETTGFVPGLVEALAHEGITGATLTARRTLSGTIPDTFSTAIDNPGGHYATFIADGQGPDGPVRIAGFWLQTPQGEDAGASFQMFIAPVRSFTAMGGWFVPAARYFDISFVDPAKADLLTEGGRPPEEAAQKIAEHFGEFMSFILQSQALMSAMTQQTLRIQQGLGQTDARGLQDPMYDP